MDVQIAKSLDNVNAIDGPDGRLLKASQVNTAMCEHGTMHIQFFDKAGDVFAIASLPLKLAAHFLIAATVQVEEQTVSLEQAASPN